MPNPNEYYALMQALQQPNLQRRQREQEGMNQLLTKIGQQVLQYKAQKDIESKISEAEKSGKKVEYKIDPQTGMVTPVISSQSYETLFEALKNPDVASKYELGRGSKGEPRLIKKKQISSTKLAGIKNILSGENDLFKVRNPIGGEDTDFDINKEEDIQKALEMAGILEDASDWKNNPELIEAGVPAAWEKRIKSKQEKITQENAKKTESFFSKFFKSSGPGQGAIATELLRSSYASKHPIVKKALEIQARNPNVKPQEAVLQAQKEIEGKAGKFKAGDTAVIEGITYTRDEEGKWRPSAS